MLGLTTAKAYVSSLLTGVGAIAAALLQANIGGAWAIACLCIVAMCAAYGITWATPNANAPAHARTVDGEVEA